MLQYSKKKYGYVLAGAGIIMAVLYFTVNFRFEIPVFAVFSSYMEVKFFTFFKTNFADELIILSILAGLLLLVFTREKEEKEEFRELRFRAAALTALLNSAVLAASLLFIYGGGFMGILIGNIFSPFILYLLIFGNLKSRSR